MRALSGRVFLGRGSVRGGAGAITRAAGSGGGACEGGGGHHINVTPLIDVVMVMIIFFLIVGKLAADQRADVDLPAGSALDGSAQARPLIVNVTETGAIVVLGEVVTEDGLDARLRDGVARARRERVVSGSGADTADGALHVQIRADRGLAYGRVQPVVRACARAGVERVTFVTEGVGGGAGVGVGGGGGEGGGG